MPAATVALVIAAIEALIASRTAFAAQAPSAISFDRAGHRQFDEDGPAERGLG